MALRLLNAHVPQDLAPRAEEALGEAGAEQVWCESGGSFGSVVKAVIGAGRTGRALDLLHERLENVGGFRVLVLPLDAVLPRPHASGSNEGREELLTAAAVSREEVYANVSEGAELSSTYLALVVLSATVAAIGLSKNSAAAVIGAMVVAPLLGPTMALALGLTLGDTPLVRSAIRTNLVGLAIAFATAVAFALVLQPDPTLSEIASRTRVDVSDMILALAAGCAGTLAYTTGAPSYLVGVMVAVALLPPAVVAGMLVAAGEMQDALGAMGLVAANVIALNVASMATFLGKGMRPRTWWRAEQAKRSARRGLSLFVGLLVVLVAAILATQFLLP